MQPVKRNEHPVDFETVSEADAKKKRKIEVEFATESEGSSISPERITLTRTELTNTVYGLIFDITGGKNKALSEASDSGNLELVKYLVDSDVDPNTGIESEKPLWCAAENGHADVVRFLLEQGANPDIKQRTGRGLGSRHCTPLMIAISKGHNEVAEVLMEFSQVLENEEQAKKLLEVALKDKNCAVVCKLVEAGVPIDNSDWNELVAEVFKKALKDDSYEDLESLFKLRPTGVHPFMPSARKHKTSEAVKILLEHGHGLNEEDKSYYRLSDAVRKKNLEAVKELLASGIDLNQTDRFVIDKHPVVLAAKNGWIEGLKEMVKSMDDSHINIIEQAYHDAIRKSQHLCHLFLRPIIEEYVDS